MLLGELDAGLLRECGCYFARGTAIALQLGEFRRSDDIDFLCASTSGYRRLREAVFARGLGALGAGLPVLRAARSDQYGIRAVLGGAGDAVKFEIVREARIALAPDPATIAGVTLLSRDDLYAEKLLANADRGLDTSTLHRDFIDLCVMIRRWGPIPTQALDKAMQAYGATISAAFSRVAGLLRNPDHLHRTLHNLEPDVEVPGDVTAVLDMHARGEMPDLLPE